VSALEIAKSSLERNCSRIPIPRRQKAHSLARWQRLSVTRANVAQHSSRSDLKVGIRLASAHTAARENTQHVERHTQH
jgi:hypothetical protein